MAGGYRDGLRHGRPWCGTAPPTQLKCHSPTHAEFVTCNHTIEPGFRSDKRKGWQWEASQVQGLAHHERLLLAMAWATLVVLCIGVEEAQQRLAAAQARPWRKRLRQVRHARESVFTLGLRALQRWLFGTERHAWRWWLPALDAPSWERQWAHWQAMRLLQLPPVRP